MSVVRFVTKEVSRAVGFLDTDGLQSNSLVKGFIPHGRREGVLGARKVMDENKYPLLIKFFNSSGLQRYFIIRVPFIALLALFIFRLIGV